MTYLIFDAVVALILLINVFRGYRKGFILTLCGFLAIFVAFIGASAVSNVLAEPVSRTIRPMVENSLEQLFTDYLAKNGDAALPGDAQLPTQQPSDGLPPDPDAQPSTPAAPDLPVEEALAALKESKLFQGFADAVQKAIDEGLVAATANAARVIASYIAKQLAQSILFFVSFVLILVFWFFLSHTVNLAFKLPILSTLNHWTGAGLGLFNGAFLIFIACWILRGSILPQDIIANTRLLNFFCTFDPMTLFP